MPFAALPFTLLPLLPPSALLLILWAPYFIAYFIALSIILDIDDEGVDDAPVPALGAFTCMPDDSALPFKMCDASQNEASTHSSCENLAELRPDEAAGAQSISHAIPSPSPSPSPSSPTSPRTDTHTIPDALPAHALPAHEPPAQALPHTFTASTVSSPPSISSGPCSPKSDPKSSPCSLNRSCRGLSADAAASAAASYERAHQRLASMKQRSASRCSSGSGSAAEAAGSWRQQRARAYRDLLRHKSSIPRSVERAQTAQLNRDRAAASSSPSPSPEGSPRPSKQALLSSFSSPRPSCSSSLPSSPRPLSSTRLHLSEESLLASSPRLRGQLSYTTRMSKDSLMSTSSRLSLPTTPPRAWRP